MIIIGEKINGSIPSVAKAIAERDADWIRNLAKIQTEAGADFIDVCASVKDQEVETLHWLIDLVQEVTDVPISIDSPNPESCVACMAFCKKPGLINSVSMEGKKADIIFPAMLSMLFSFSTSLSPDLFLLLRHFLCHLQFLLYHL